jgi:hypothetical protein
MKKLLLLFCLLPTVYFAQCNPPTNITTSYIGWNYASINWDAGGSETSWEISWGYQGFIAGSANKFFKNSNNYSLSGLSENTSYDIYIRSICDDGSGSTDTSAWSGPVNFTTLNYHLGWTGGTTYIVDSDFEHYLETHNANGNLVTVGDPTSMGDGLDSNNLVFTANIINVTSLNLDSIPIWNFQGIENFISLEHLSCRYSSLDDISLSNNTALKTLDCSFNTLSHLDLVKNTALTDLVCMGATNNFNSAWELSHSINYLNLTQNTSLKNLNCSGNFIKNLDLSQNTLLENLICAYNLLNNIDVSNNPSLKILNCGYNPLTSLDVSNNPQLRELNSQCGHGYSSFVGLQPISYEVSGQSSHLYTSTNINNFDLTNNHQLEILEIDQTYNDNGWQFNIINLSNLSQNPNLKIVDLNPVKNVVVTGNPNLLVLALRSEYPNNSQNLTDFTAMSSIDLSQNPNLKFLFLDHYPIQNLDLT